MRIACVTYRDWALAIYDELARFEDLEERVYRRRKTKSAVRAFPGPFSEVVALTSLVVAVWG